MKMKYLFPFLFVIMMILFHNPVKALTRPIQSDSLWYKNNLNYQLQIGYYDVYKTKQADIVMLGNSITHGANWAELLGRSNVVDRGVPSDIVEGMLNRMDYIYKLHPKVCFIMAGVNDIYSWIPNETILKNYLEIINGLKAHNIKVVIFSTLHTSADWAKDWLETNRPDLDVYEYNLGRNNEINKLNQSLSTYARSSGIEFVDLNKSMSNNNFIKKHLTYDGTHLNANGYKIWRDAVDKILKKYGM